METLIKRSRSFIERIDLVDGYNSYGNIGYMDAVFLPNDCVLLSGTITLPNPNDIWNRVECPLPSAMFSTKWSGFLEIFQVSRNASQILQLYEYNGGIDRYGNFFFEVDTWNESKITVALPVHFIMYGRNAIR